MNLRLAPGPRGYPLVGALPTLRKDPLAFFLSLRRDYGDVASFRLAGRRFTLLAHPDHIRHVLQENAGNYIKGVNIRKLKPLIGEGLLTSEGEFWRRQRKLAQPAFHHQRIASLANVVDDATARMLERWTPGSVIDVAAEMMRLTLSIVTRALFSTDISDEAEEVGRLLTIALREINRRAWSWWNTPEWLPTPRNRRFRKAVQGLDRVVYRLIEERRRQPAAGRDLLSMLLEATEAGEGMSNRQLRDEVMTLLLAGHETTANALAWTWYLLSLHPDVERRLHADPDSSKRIIEEAMRLYPPAWSIYRTPIQDDEVGGFRLAAGSVVALSPYVTHRHPAFWPNPDVFDPDRFAVDPPRFAYFPFGGGPRVCIGSGLAMMEAQLIVAQVARRFRLELDPTHPVEARPMVTLRPRTGIRMKLSKRN